MPDPAKPGAPRNPERMETLGDKLKRIEAAAAAQGDQRAAADRGAAEVTERRRKQAVRQQFETWKQDITSAIKQDKLPPSLRLASAPPPDGRTGSLISGPANPDHDLFLDFQRWATDLGLNVRVDFADGRGGGGELLTISSRS